MKGELQAEKSPKTCARAWNAERSMHAARRWKRQALPFQYPGWKLTPYHLQDLARGLSTSRLALAPLLKHRFGPCCKLVNHT